ncbi:hypothetical protein [Leuconostoc pseudomesenteroides]|uniref:hypothetical protein n=1 Tax=Leuconostoc pseudomesenteroides TaxID=33968 RepID=UPI0021A4698F|nr:hypothetical protein [Leuconostoc pseudomesenteroides]MCT4381591.1 hypothetical protein [Leuconostoc pseudomesenteroides]
MKFTEEQYQKIVDVADKYIKKSGWGLIGTNLDAPIGTIFEETDLMGQVEFEYVNQEMMAIANPLTREWARDNFVEEEKKSHFVLKDVRDDNGNLYHLIENSGAVVLNPWLNSGYQPKIKESDVRKWGFNPEIFDREEA